MQRIIVCYTHSDKAIAIVQKIRRCVSRLRLCKAIRNHSLTTAIEILEVEGFYDDVALMMLAYKLVGGAS